MGHRMSVSVSSQVLPLVLFLAILSVQTSLAQFKSSIDFRFREEQDAGTYVGNVAIASGLTGSLSEAEFSRLRFELSNTDLFDIDARTGSLSASQRIDRESVCEGLKECMLKFNIVVYQTDNLGNYDLYKYITAVVNVTDINDNAPEFPSESVSLSIPEGNDVDAVLRTSGAVDRDTGGENSVKQYSFQDPTDTFTLTVHKNPDGSTYLGIVIKEKLDREKRDFYQVTVLATDGGFPQKSGSVLINITVDDVNDNEPEFDQLSYNESVQENVALNVPIMKVHATDKDTGRNAEISYQFSSRVTNKIRQKFYIDEHTGEIFAQNRIDYEEDKQFQFIVEAVDQGIPQYSSRAGVTLHVIDMNDNAPQININLPPKGTDVAENEPVGKFIAHVSVLDMDSGINGAVICAMDDEHFSLEKFYDYASNMYKVILAKPLDHEQAPSHKVSITCSDSGRPSLSNSTTFVVNVLDVNDNRPAFTESTYYGSVRENLLGEREVLTVKAHDWDSGDLGKVSYSIEDKYNGLFTIDPETGVIKVMHTLDRESMPTYEFHVIARDNGPERLSSSSLIVITVDDENDEPPRFMSPIYFGDVLENQPVGTSVGNVTAIDPDSTENSKMTYTILRQGTDYSNFSIDPKTGVIKSTVTFDREEKIQYQFKIKVTDPTNALFFSTCNFTVRVLDDNDHAPVIHMSSEENTTILIQYSAPVGSVITTILAYDGDEASSQHSQLTYLIQKGDPDELFNLNRYTGSLALARTVTAKDIKTYALVIKVQDGGDPPRYDTKEIYIKINGTIPPPAQGGLSQNILIVVILVGVTIVLALAILATICLIKKIDRQRRQNRATQKLSEEKMYQLKQQDVFTNISADNVDDSNSNNLSKKGKKEVSFSLDEETDSHNTSAGSGHPLTSFKYGTDRTDGFPPNKLSGPSKLGNGVMNIPVHPDKQNNLQQRSIQDEECHLIEILKKSAEDALSESSGETDPSDSGRGGSEDDSSHRGSGVDPEHNNSNNLFPQVYHNRSPHSPTDGRDKHQQPYHQQQTALHLPKRTWVPTNKGKPLRQSGIPHRSPRNSLSSDIDSDFSGSRGSQSRSDSDRSVPSNPYTPHSFQGSVNPGRPASQMLPFRPRDYYPSRSLTQDSPNRLATPYNNNSAFMRSFHGHPSNNFNVAPPLTSLSMERLPHASDRSYTPSERSYQYSDRSYPASERWANHSSLPEEDDRTTTSGSYTINPDELRQEMDEMILHDSIV